MPSVNDIKGNTEGEDIEQKLCNLIVLMQCIIHAKQYEIITIFMKQCSVYLPLV